MDSLVINHFFHILAGTLICKFLPIPDWLKLRKVKQYFTAASSRKIKR